MNSSTRSLTPLRKTYELPINFSSFLNMGEFPVFDSIGKRLCPPAPPRNPMVMRICVCTRTYQIVDETSPIKKCGFCINHS